MSKCAIVLLTLCAGLHAQNTSIDGTAVDPGGRPLPGVHVRLISVGANGNPAAYGSVSDRDGHFSMVGMKPGSYIYFGEKVGYVSVRKGSRQGGVPFEILSVKAGEKTSDLKLEMQPRSTISGRVLDDYGDPIQNATVQVTPVSPDAPVAFSFGTASMQTDDRGEFHIPVAGGRYHVKATVYAGQMRASEIRTDGTSPAAYIPTYYPSAPSTDRAVPVDIGIGAEARGIEIRMTFAGGAKGGGVSAEGTVTGAPDLRSAAVYLYISETPGRYSYYQATGAGDGRFRFTTLRPGKYRLFARMQSADRNMQSQMVDFSDTAPPSGVELRLTSGADVAATVSVENGGKLPAGKRAIKLRPIGDSTYMIPVASGSLDADGNARVSGVFAGRHRLAVTPLPDGMYVKSVDLDGTVGDELDFSGGASRLKVTLAAGAAQVSGAAVEQDGTRLANTLGAVLLIRDKTKPEIDEEDGVARLAPDGSYSFKGLRPGKYWLLAIDIIRTGDFTSPESLKKFVEVAEEIELKEGEKLRKDVRVVSKEAMDAKPKQ